MAAAESLIALDADRPNANSTDLYNRKAFVQRLAHAVAQRPGRDPFIIGIEGSWGEGKSTVLEYMARELEAKHQDVTLVRFNPWTYQGQDQMLVGLVRVIHEQLEQRPKFEALGPKLLGFVGTTAALDLAPVSGASLIANRAADWEAHETQTVHGTADPGHPRPA